MQITKFRATTLKVAKSKTDVQRDRGKRTRADVVVKTVMGETINHFIDKARDYIRYVAKERLQHPSFKSDLIAGLVWFDYRVLLQLPKPQAIDCYRHMFQSFSSRGWLSRELRNVHMEIFCGVRG